jgi:hypothetical protein
MNEKINYDGVKFGMLTILRDGNGLYEGKRKRRSVICKCDCGNDKEILLRQLTKGNQKSCGCLSSKRTEFEVGEKISFWTVVRPDAEAYISPKGDKMTTCEVQCVCGKISVVTKQSLKSGGSNSCGCRGVARQEKIKKEKIIPTDTEDEQWVDLFIDNNYLVSNLGRLFSKKTYKYLTWSKEPRIKGNKSISLHKEVYRSFNGDYDENKYRLIFIDGNQRNRKLDNLYLACVTDNGVNWITRLKQNFSSNRKEDIDISTKDIIDQYNKQQGLSYFLKIPLDITMQDKLSSVSIDRIDNDKGYTKDNFTLVTRFENMGRNINTFEEMVKFSNRNFYCTYLTEEELI